MSIFALFKQIAKSQKSKRPKINWGGISFDALILGFILKEMPMLISFGNSWVCLPNCFSFFKESVVIAPCGCYHPQGVDSEEIRIKALHG
ncbi:MAG: hypothetical protein AMJ89_01590 [candidate division Zixibacteria bacterium SM23_73]|uniref:Uncharacterized protein n=1 Tax=candidate division WOR-1 bacterium DG_54_3 TaxID=1703775 RepID=A0A0S7Y239_UNCSA|nr:MAG: hypothetical protein AMJ44_06105 [candidate division WOR-1 bacterium DG_54_3]KPK77910.1 MAG: hypothetical protein AMJ89_01590 [candidate division Zixibacteria bacterium SM23_73]